MTRCPRPFVLVFAALAAATMCLPAYGAGQPGRRAGGQRMFGGMRGMGGLNLLGVATNKEAQSRLGMTEEEVAAVNKVAEESRAARGDRRGGGFPRVGRDATQEERQAAMEKFRKEMEARQKKTASALKAALKGKYGQLVKMAAGVALQEPSAGRGGMMGRGGGPTALGNAAVAEAVGLSKKSQQAVTGIVEAMNKEIMEAFQAARGGGDFAAVREKVQEIRKTAEGKIREALTEKEKKSVMECVKLGKGITLGRGRRGPGGEGRGRRGGAAPPQ